jgi:hypothetical protein
MMNRGIGIVGEFVATPRGDGWGDIRVVGCGWC